MAQKSQGRLHQGSGSGFGSWREKEDFEEARNGMGCFSVGMGGSVIKHRADGKPVCLRRRKRTL